MKINRTYGTLIVFLLLLLVLVIIVLLAVYATTLFIIIIMLLFLISSWKLASDIINKLFNEKEQKSEQEIINYIKSVCRKHDRDREEI